jgi:hypothetical protein
MAFYTIKVMALYSVIPDKLNTSCTKMNYIVFLLNVVCWGQPLVETDLGYITCLQ